MEYMEKMAVSDEALLVGSILENLGCPGVGSGFDDAETGVRGGDGLSNFNGVGGTKTRVGASIAGREREEEMNGCEDKKRTSSKKVVALVVCSRPSLTTNYTIISQKKSSLGTRTTDSQLDCKLNGDGEDMERRRATLPGFDD